MIAHDDYMTIKRSKTTTHELAYCTAQKQVGEGAADNGILGIVFAPSEPWDCDSEGLEKGNRERV